MEFEIQDRRDDTIQFQCLKFLECFYIGDPTEPYIRVPHFLRSTNESGSSPPEAKDIREFNALRIRTLEYIYLVPENIVHKLHSKLVLTTEPLKIEERQNAGQSNNGA